MRAYVAAGPNASSASLKTGVTVIASASVRPAVCDILIGSSQTPADQAAQFALQRFTAVGTAGSNPTPPALDASDVAAVATVGITHSAEPTYTASTAVKKISMNQRATFRYICNPGYEFKAPATASNGLGIYLVSATAASVYDFELTWFE